MVEKKKMTVEMWQDGGTESITTQVHPIFFNLTFPHSFLLAQNGSRSCSSSCTLFQRSYFCSEDQGLRRDLWRAMSEDTK